MQDIIDLLKTNKYTIGSCESCTAGLYTSTLASFSGASAVLKGGFVTYHNETKINVLGIEQDLIEQYGVVSEEIALEMAICARRLLQVDICVSFTGNAGPDCLEDKPAGYICAALVTPEGQYTFTWIISGDRNFVRQRAVTLMNDEIINRLR